MNKFHLALLSAAAAGLILVSCSGSETGADADGTVTDSGESTDETSETITFTSTDLDGNTVDQSVFSGKKLTMVNIWATYCGPCISEMPDLAEISDDYADKDFQIIGIPVDVMSGDEVIEDTIDSAHEIIDETGADYLHILPSESVSDALLGSVMYVPTTIFVDENGNQVGDSYIGSKSASEWTEIIDSLLEQIS